MKRPPTPTTGGNWRVIDGQLVEELPGLPVDALPVERLGGPGIAVPPADEPNTPESTPPASRQRGGKKTDKE